MLYSPCHCIILLCTVVQAQSDVTQTLVALKFVSAFSI